MRSYIDSFTSRRDLSVSTFRIPKIVIFSVAGTYERVEFLFLELERALQRSAQVRLQVLEEPVAARQLGHIFLESTTEATS